MVQISIDYTGNLHCRCEAWSLGHRSSRPMPRSIIKGKGESFSPTDLVATALGTCIATTMAIVAERHQVELKGMTVQVTKGNGERPRGESAA